QAAFELISKNTQADYKLFPGKHYDIYYKHSSATTALAIKWFEAHLTE
ncbi:uncharacterized protein METZ01_LOCUS288757, partial [marine metagenome]